MAHSGGGSLGSNWQVDREHAEADCADLVIEHPLDDEHADGGIISERQAINVVAAILGVDAGESLVSSVTKPLQAGTSPFVSDPQRQLFEEFCFRFALNECIQLIDQDVVPKRKTAAGRARQAKKENEARKRSDRTLSPDRLVDAKADSLPEDCLNKDQLAGILKTAVHAESASEPAAVPTSAPSETNLNLQCVIASNTQEPASSSAPCAAPVEKKKRKPPKRKLVSDEIQSVTALQTSSPSGGTATSVQSLQATDAQLQSSSHPGERMPVASTSFEPTGGNPRPPKRPRKTTSGSEESRETATSLLVNNVVDALSGSSSSLAPSANRRRRPPHNSRTARADSDDEDFEPSSSGRRRSANNSRSSQEAEDGTGNASSNSQASTPTAERRSTRQSAIRASERLHDTAQLLEEFERDAADLDAYYAYNRIIEPVVRLDDISDASDNEFENDPEMNCAIAASLEAPVRVVKEEPEKASEEPESTEAMEPEHRCIICFDVSAVKPVACAHCKQFLGCKVCVKRWYRTTNISELNRRSPLSRGQSHINHRSCPLCRIEWQETPEVIPYCMLSRTSVEAELTVEVKEEVETEESGSSSPVPCSTSPPVESPDAGVPFDPTTLSELSQFVWNLAICSVI
ncbi:hypothetical protein AAVH_06230 [Aphelenchoides avenae]|nr:hypothetical protein AAVH_06230 [Aphelenchus avenae]